MRVFAEQRVNIRALYEHAKSNSKHIDTSFYNYCGSDKNILYLLALTNIYQCIFDIISSSRQVSITKYHLWLTFEWLTLVYFNFSPIICQTLDALRRLNEKRNLYSSILIGQNVRSFVSNFVLVFKIKI